MPVLMDVLWRKSNVRFVPLPLTVGADGALIVATAESRAAALVTTVLLARGSAVRTCRMDVDDLVVGSIPKQPVVGAELSQSMVSV